MAQVLPRNRTAVFSWSLAAFIFSFLCMALFYFRPIAMVIAVSRTDLAELKIAQLLMDYTRNKSSRLRLSIVQTSSPEDALQMLEKGQVELAIGRSDMKMPESSTSIAVFKQMQPFFALSLQKNLSAEPVPAWLKGKTIGYPSSPISNRILLESILRQWQLLDTVTLVPVAPGQLVSISQRQKLDGHFTVNAANVDSAGARVLAAVKTIFPVGFSVLPLSDSAALIGKIPGLEDGIIPRGFFSSSPPLPAEELTSAALLSNLMVAKDVPDDAIAGTVKALLAMKEAQLSRNPDLANVAEPSKTNRNVAFNSVALKVHDGVFEDIFDRYANQIYIGLAVLGGIASLGSGAYRKQRQALKSEISIDLKRLLIMQDGIAKPTAAEELERIGVEAQSIYRSALDSAALGQISGAQLMAVDLAYKRLLELSHSQRHPKLQRPKVR